MKKFSLLFILVLTGQLVFSQLILTNSTNLTFGDSFKNDVYDGVTSITPGPAGPNQTWDFSTITGGTYIEGTPAECVAPATTVFGDSAAALNADICVKTEGVDGMYQYLKSGASYQDYLALGFYQTGGTSLTTYKDILRVIEFPFSYGDSFSDDFASWMYSIDNGSYIMADSGTVTVEADAWGTVTTPTGTTYNNTLRLIETRVSSTWLYFDGIWIPGGGITIIDYSWYAPNIKVPVISISYVDGFPDYTISYLVDHNFHVGITELINPKLNIYPNPTSDKFTVSTDQEINTISIYNSSGILMNTIKTQAQTFKYSVDFSMYSNGVYFIEVDSRNGNIMIEKIVMQ